MYTFNPILLSKKIKVAVGGTYSIYAFRSIERDRLLDQGMAARLILKCLLKK
jgi:hypothetical protein